MKQLLILSGKGGTGKTTTASCFIKFSNAKAYADCDVDAPNLHIVTKSGISPTQKDFYGSDKANIKKDKCTLCGLCFEKCRFNAIIKNKDYYSVNEYACEGCGVCLEICPKDAVIMQPDVAGKTILYDNDNNYLSSAELKMGRGNSGKLVTEVKRNLPQIEDGIAIIDGSPGIGCPVIASISGVDLVLIVAEPSISGISDMQRIVKTSQNFNTPVAICVNKYDNNIDNTKIIEEFCELNSISFVGKIPYDSNVSKAINNKISVADIECPARGALLEVYKKTIKLL